MAWSVGIAVAMLVLTAGAMFGAACVHGQSWRLSALGHGIKLNAYPHHSTPDVHGGPIGCYPGWEGVLGPICFQLTYW